MKKYYGPIVLGIAALTVAAATQTTTAKADAEEQSEEQTTPDQNTGTTPETTTADLIVNTNLEGTENATVTIKDIDITGKIAGDTVTINKDQIPTIAGYTPEATSLTATVGEDGASLSTTDSLNYVKDTDTPTQETTKADLTINTNLQGTENATVTIKDIDITGKVAGDTITINKDQIPTITGYTSETTSLTATVGEDGTSLSTTDTLNYTKDDSTETQVQKDLNDELASIDTLLKDPDLGNDQKAQLTEIKKDYTVKAANAKTDADRQSILNDLKADIELNTHKTTSGELKSLINYYIDNTNIFKSSNPTALKNLNDTIIAELKNIPTDGTTPAEINQSIDSLNNILGKYTTTVQIGKTKQHNIPVIKDASVSFPYNEDLNNPRYVSLDFDKDGQIVGAAIVDKNGNAIRTNDKITIQRSADDKNPITTKNQPLQNNNSNTTTTTDHKKPVTTPEVKPSHSRSFTDYSMTYYAKPGSFVSLYDGNGNAIKNRSLAENSAWHADCIMTLDGIKYARVATDEWARLDDGLEISPINEVVTTKNDAALFTANGTRVRNRALSKNTAWRTDKSATINGQTMYRVATNEWVSAYDLK